MNTYSDGDIENEREERTFPVSYGCSNPECVYKDEDWGDPVTETDD